MTTLLFESICQIFLWKDQSEILKYFSKNSDFTQGSALKGCLSFLTSLTGLKIKTFLLEWLKKWWVPLWMSYKLFSILRCCSSLQRQFSYFLCKKRKWWQKFVCRFSGNCFLRRLLAGFIACQTSMKTSALAKNTNVTWTSSATFLRTIFASVKCYVMWAWSGLTF